MQPRLAGVGGWIGLMMLSAVFFGLDISFAQHFMNVGPTGTKLSQRFTRCRHYTCRSCVVQSLAFLIKKALVTQVRPPTPGHEVF